MDRILFALTTLVVAVVIGCDAGGLIVVKTIDASADAPTDVDQDALDPVPIPDADVCSCNGGSGGCTSAANCPPDNKCCSFQCVPAGEVGKQCIGIPKQ